MNLNNKYKSWTESERKFIFDNYLKLNNKELALQLCRTQESIRKELDKMKLRRPKKADPFYVPIKRGRKKMIKSVSESIKEGLLARKKLANKLEKQDKIKGKIKKEKEWANSYLNKKNIPAEIKLIDPIVVFIPKKRMKVYIDRNNSDKLIRLKINKIKKKYMLYECQVLNYK